MKKMVLLLILPLFLALVFSACCCPKKKAAQEMPMTEVAAVKEVQETPPPQETTAEATLEPIYFDFDKSNLKTDATATLYKNAEWLSKNPTAKIRIEGNCDERGTVEYNVALGEHRANSAKQYLIKLGVTSARLSTISYGKEKPFDPGHNEAAWTKNRRDDFKVLE